jgi:Protein of unknown function (DUF3108)
MIARVSTVIAVLAAVALGGAAFYWLHTRSVEMQPAIAAAPDAASSQKPDVNADKPPKNPSTLPDATKKAPAPAKSSSGSPETNAALPLRTGEILDFTADVAKVSNVANLRLQVTERRNFLGKSAWHLQAFAHTENPLRMVFELDDQFDSYSDANTLLALQYEMHLSERGQKVDTIQRMTTTGKEPAPSNAAEARVLPGTRDPLGMMQLFRNTDWTRTHEVRGPVYDGRKLYDVRAALLGMSEPVTVPAGSFTANKIEIRVFNGAEEMKDAHFFLYLDHDAARTPVLLEAILPFANARVALKSKN